MRASSRFLVLRTCSNKSDSVNEYATLIFQHSPASGCSKPDDHFRETRASSLVCSFLKKIILISEPSSLPSNNLLFAIFTVAIIMLSLVFTTALALPLLGASAAPQSRSSTLHLSYHTNNIFSLVTQLHRCISLEANNHGSVNRELYEQLYIPYN